MFTALECQGWVEHFSIFEDKFRTMSFVINSVTYLQPPCPRSRRRCWSSAPRLKPRSGSGRTMTSSPTWVRLGSLKNYGANQRKEQIGCFSLVEITSATYINRDAILSEKGRGWMIARQISVELVSILVPLHRIELFVFHVVVTLEIHRVVLHRVVGNANFNHSKCSWEFWNWRKYLKHEFWLKRLKFTLEHLKCRNSGFCSWIFSDFLNKLHLKQWNVTFLINNVLVVSRNI